MPVLLSPRLKNVSRMFGNATEYMVCKCLMTKRYKPMDDYTTNRFNTMKANFEEVEKDVTMCPAKIGQAVDYIINQSACHAITSSGNQTLRTRKVFQLQKDTAGSSSCANPTTSDIIIGNNIHISIKNNNLSIKHQKANKLGLQMKMDEEDRKDFERDYSQINDDFFMKWSDRDSFSNVTLIEKMEMYNKINALTMFYLTKVDPYQYLLFILDLATPHYILKCNVRKNTIAILKSNITPEVLSSKSSSLTMHVKGTILYICMDEYTIKMRLHNCTSKITKTLGIKYDTTLHKNMFTSFTPFDSR